MSLTGGMNLDECSLKMRHPEVSCNNQLYSEMIYIPRVKPGRMNKVYMGSTVYNYKDNPCLEISSE